MALSIFVEKVDESPTACRYTFGTDDETVGTVRLHKATGDLELVSIADAADAPARPPFYLGHVVPRLQDYHAREHYPPHDQWAV